MYIRDVRTDETIASGTVYKVEKKLNRREPIGCEIHIDSGYVIRLSAAEMLKIDAAPKVTML